MFNNIQTEQTSQTETGTLKWTHFLCWFSNVFILPHGIWVTCLKTSFIDTKIALSRTKSTFECITCSKLMQCVLSVKSFGVIRKVWLDVVIYFLNNLLAPNPHSPSICLLSLSLSVTPTAAVGSAAADKKGNHFGSHEILSFHVD